LENPFTSHIRAGATPQPQATSSTLLPSPHLLTRGSSRQEKKKKAVKLQSWILERGFFANKPSCWEHSPQICQKLSAVNWRKQKSVCWNSMSSKRCQINYSSWITHLAHVKKLLVSTKLASDQSLIYFIYVDVLTWQRVMDTKDAEW